jgi:ribosomal protein L32
MEMNVIKCPNCGASSTNHTNCEYCGSLLVRFVDKGIDLSTTSYLTNDKVYAGLIEALKQNLDRQELSDSAVETGIFYKSSPTVKLSRKRHGVATVFRSGSTTWSDGDPIRLGDKNRGLVIKFSFDIHAEENDVADDRIEKQHQEFKALGSFPLFTAHTGIYMRPGSSSRFRSQEYAIDFGQDVEGAARLISEVLSKVYGIPEDAQLIYLGEEDETPVEKKIEDQQENVEQDEGLSTSQKVGLGVATLFAVSVFFVNPSYRIIASICSICAVIAIVAIIMGKLDKKYSWYISCIYFAIMMGVGMYNAPDLENAEIRSEQKASDTKQETMSNEVEQAPKKSRIDEIRELGYNDGVKYGYSDGGEALRDYVQMGLPLEEGLKHIQNVIAPVAYKEDYGDNISKELLDEYAKQFVEGYKSVVLKK